MTRKSSDSRTDRSALDGRLAEPGSQPPADRPELACRAIVDSPESGPDVCTIYSTASEDSLVTTWISARDDAYCSLDDCR